MCKIIRTLAQLLPIKRLQALLIESHQSRCPHCGETGDLSRENDMYQSLFISPQQASTEPSLWSGVREGIQSQDSQPQVISLNRPRHRAVRGWQWAAAAMLVIAVLAVPVLVKRKNPVTANPNHAPANKTTVAQYITVRSVTYGGQTARTHVFNSTEPEITMVWIEKS